MRSWDRGRYGHDVLAGDWQGPRGGRGRRNGQLPQVEAAQGLVVETADASFCGAVVACDKQAVTLADRFGRRRVFPLAAATFLLEGKPVTLVRQAPGEQGPARGRARTPSGSVALPQVARARVARASRIYVEGLHDAELVERIWGDDLRIEGVVVEYLEGADHLPALVTEFAPGPDRRLGVLLDHLVAGSKESRIAAAVKSPHVHVTGHEFVDIWQAVKPSVLGIDGWPEVPRGIPWKEGIVAALGWGAGTTADTSAAWRRILAAVSTYADLEVGLLRSVEELIDFVTASK
jgi:Protein of unknown function (DUF3097)